MMKMNKFGMALSMFLIGGCRLLQLDNAVVEIEVYPHSLDQYGLIQRPYQCQSESIEQSGDKSDFNVDFLVLIRNISDCEVYLATESYSHGYYDLEIAIRNENGGVFNLKKRQCAWVRNLPEYLKIEGGESMLYPVSLDRRIWDGMPLIYPGEKLEIKVSFVSGSFLVGEGKKIAGQRVDSEWTPLLYRSANKVSVL